MEFDHLVKTKHTLKRCWNRNRINLVKKEWNNHRRWLILADVSHKPCNNLCFLPSMAIPVQEHITMHRPTVYPAARIHVIVLTFSKAHAYQVPLQSVKNLGSSHLRIKDWQLSVKIWGTFFSEANTQTNHHYVVGFVLCRRMSLLCFK